jgi:predicted aminopeptidase
MIRKVLLILLVILTILILWYFPLINYGFKQGLGQLQVVWNSRDIEEVKADPNVPDSIKMSLDYVREVVAFGVREIGLEDEGNYQTYFDQKGIPVLFVVTGAEPFSLTPYEWKFPVIGVVPYKGFFDKDDAETEKQKLLDLGYDADMRMPGGWSTLGWFKDPVLSNMLARSKGDLANVILHELTHATVFVKDSIEYNENLATFIGDEATLIFLREKFGEGSPEWIRYQEDEEDFKRYANHILRGADKLDSLYQHIGNRADSVKIRLKTLMIEKIISSADTINFHRPENFRWEMDVLPNNAYFLSFLRYRVRQDYLKDILRDDFNNNLKSFVKYLHEKYN